LGNNSGSAGQTAAFTPDLALQWLQTPDPVNTTGQFVGTLADVAGLGRPQFIATSPFVPMLFQDGRTGNPAIGLPSISVLADYPFNPFSYLRHTPPVVDWKGDGTSGVAFGLVGQVGQDAWSAAVPGPIYATASILIFSSPHWKRMPTVWPTKHYIKDR